MMVRRFGPNPIAGKGTSRTAFSLPANGKVLPNPGGIDRSRRELSSTNAARASAAPNQGSHRSALK